MKAASNNHEFKIVHIMKDGEVRDSIEGLTPPVETGCYDILIKMLEEQERRVTA